MKQKLKINLDENIPAEYKAQVPIWLEEVAEWLLAHPRTADLEHTAPAFSELDMFVGTERAGRGLRNRKTGKGWLTLRFRLDHFNLETRPLLTEVDPAEPELACRVSWCYLLSQLFRPEGAFTDAFRWEEHLAYQMEYFEFLDSKRFAVVNKEIRRKKAAAVNKARRKAAADNRRKKQAEQKQVLAAYSAKRLPKVKKAPAKPVKPFKLPTDAERVEQHKAMWLEATGKPCPT